MKPELFADETAEVFRLAPYFHAAAAKDRVYGVRLDGLWVRVGRPRASPRRNAPSIAQFFDRRPLSRL